VLFRSEVTVSNGTPVFLLRGADYLQRTTVRTAVFNPEGLVLPDVNALTLACNGCEGAYRLRIADKRTRDSDPPKASRLLLERNGVEQILYEWPEGLLDQHCELVWAGDLDGDGKLDLFMNLSDHYNVTEATLFLSSRSRADKLVEPVAVFRTVGC